MYTQTLQIKHWLIAVAFLVLQFSVQAQDQTINGKLKVGQDLKAGTDSSNANFEFRSNGVLISKGVYSGRNILSGTDQFNGMPKLLWNPAKAVFRAGTPAYWSWEDGSCGVYSAAFGYGTTASGKYSTAAGYMTYALGNYSTAMGTGCYARGTASTAFGGSYAYGMGSTAFSASYAKGDYSASFGCSTTANGQNTAVFGQSTKADASHSVVIGRYNVGGCETGGDKTWIETDPIFEIGNGQPPTTQSPAVLSDAFVVYKNGDAAFQGVVEAAPGGDIPMFTGQ